MRINRNTQMVACARESAFAELVTNCHEPLPAILCSMGNSSCRISCLTNNLQRTWHQASRPELKPIACLFSVSFSASAPGYMPLSKLEIIAAKKCYEVAAVWLALIAHCVAQLSCCPQEMEKPEAATILHLAMDEDIQSWTIPCLNLPP